jgi:hypothetical protein
LIALRTSSKLSQYTRRLHRWKSPRSRHFYAARSGRTDCSSFRCRECPCGWQRCTQYFLWSVTSSTSCLKLRHLEQSTDSNPVISANGASWSSPRDVDASDRIERTPCRGHRSSRRYGVLRLLRPE